VILNATGANAIQFSHSHRIRQILQSDHIASIDWLFAFASQIRVFGFLHRYFMAIFSGKLYFRTI
jgi:hypothetical protein